jgi:very-short-patch-repair endonuclease
MASTFAHNLRATPTDAEMQLWLRLRQKQLYGLRFRRQHPMGVYIVDFFCAEAKLIIEVDGGQHADDNNKRTAWLEARGYRLIRFWNNEVPTNIDGVLLAIAEAVRTAPPPVDAGASPTSPSRGEALRMPADPS